MKFDKHTILIRLTLLVSVSLYIASLTQQCYCTTNNCGDGWTGGSILVLGAVGGIMSMAGLTWYANPMLWIAWSLINKKPERAMYYSLGAVLIALSFLLFAEVADKQAGRLAYITQYLLGYWLWVASAGVMLVGSLINYRIKLPEIKAFRSLAKIRVNFNKRVTRGVKLIDAIYKDGEEPVHLFYNMHIIIWDVDYDDNKRDDLAVEAVVKYSFKDRCWIAVFNNAALLHESEREHPLLDD